MPNALNCDEASAGYEAFSLLNYGIDRNGNHNPSFLVAWGSGQNALLTYLIIPLIKIFGLKTIAIRLPMAILGCVSLVILYLLLRKISNKKLAIIGLAFFAICPWHIMKSRWGLESNLFPDLILIFAYMLIKGIEDKNKIKKISQTIIFIYYIILIFNMVFFARYNVVNDYNLIPFKSISNILKNGNTYSIIINIFGNLFVFMPLEYFLIELFKIRKFPLNFIISFLIILLIELFQFIFKVGVLDIDDLILCILGMMIFYICYNLINKKMHSKKDDN